jgi:hypothetical protein
MIFGIGLGKTGTKSLATALNLLGFTCLHDWFTIKRSMRFERERDYPLLSTLANDYNAFVDFPIWREYPTLDKTYPNSKFIWTVRDLDSWLNSRKRHIEFRVIRKLRGDPYVPFKTEYDENYERRLYFKHHKRITKYFKNRENDVLVLDISSGDGWEKLCAFLDKPVPQIPFPYENKGVGRATTDQYLPLNDES